MPDDTPGIGHNSADAEENEDPKLALTPSEAEKLIKDIGRRIDDQLDEIDELRENVKAEYTQAKRMGLDVTAVRKAVARRRKRRDDPSDFDEKETLLDLYIIALGD